MARTVYVSRRRLGMGRVPMVAPLDLRMSEGTVSSPTSPTEFNPLSIAGCRWWLRADDLGLTGTAVNTINDKSGQGHSLVPGGTSPTATYVAAASNFNNKPVIRFNETQYYERSSGINLPFAGNPRTVFTVASQRVVPDTGPNSFFMYAAAAASPHIYQRLQATGAYRVFAENAFTTTATGLVTANAAAIWGFTFTQGTLILYKDGAQLQSFSVSLFLNASSPFMRVGTTDNTTPPTIFLDGDVAEIIVYDTVLSTTNRQAVESYLKQRYNIA